MHQVGLVFMTRVDLCRKNQNLLAALSYSAMHIRLPTGQGPPFKTLSTRKPPAPPGSPGRHRGARYSPVD
jgi:hypothetical protein